jgi:putative Holliday junction resolvase
MARVLGIDPGTRRCGIALTDSQRTLAFPRPAMEVDEHLFDLLKSLIDDESVDLVVVGRPVALSGNVTASTEAADVFFRTLEEEVSPVRAVQWDERLTTYEAEKSLSDAGLPAKAQRSHIDSAAAVIMLQNYVDALPSD